MLHRCCLIYHSSLGFPDSSVGKEYACNTGHPSLIPRSGRSPGEGIGYPFQYSWASLVAQLVKNPPAMRETWVRSLGWEDPLEKGKATHYSILTWRYIDIVHGVAMSRTWLGDFHFHLWRRRFLLLEMLLMHYWRRQWHPTLVLLPGKSHAWRSLVGCSPCGRWESDTTERLHFSLSCIGKGNGNLLQFSCLGNPRDGGAWWAAVYGVAQSRTWLKQLSSSNSRESSRQLNACAFS